jgi:hypothetical protein
MLKRLQSARSLLEKAPYSLGLRSARHLCLPDFLGIGAQKAGTTWLYENLRCHPEIFLPDQKELHYFDWGFHGSLRSYSDRFKPGVGKVKGEITPGYSILPKRRIAFISKLMPELRLVFLLRDPIERSWSQALMNLVTVPERKYEEVSEAEIRDHFESARSIQRGDYLTTIDNWLSFYPPERLYTGFYDDIIEQPRELLKEVFAHLGVSTDVDWTALPYDRVIFKGTGIPLPDRLRAVLVEMYRSDLRRLAERFGERVVRWQTGSQ